MFFVTFRLHRNKKRLAELKAADEKGG
jgi:hypothetical protein